MRLISHRSLVESLYLANEEINMVNQILKWRPKSFFSGSGMSQLAEGEESFKEWLRECGRISIICPHCRKEVLSLEREVIE